MLKIAGCQAGPGILNGLQNMISSCRIIISADTNNLLSIGEYGLIETFPFKMKKKQPKGTTGSLVPLEI